jgi:hypothetical protein
VFFETSHGGFWDEAVATWKWYNFIKNEAPTGKTTVCINLDETYVNFYQGQHKGNVAVQTHDLPVDEPPLHQRASRQQLRLGLTHVGLVCDVPLLQPLLPQVLIVPDRALLKRDLAAAINSMPGYIYVLRRPSKWVSVSILVWIMRLIAWSIRQMRSQYNVIILMDVLSQHFHPDVLQAMSMLQFTYVFVPARLTWLLQPLDTHVFALYKRHLQRVTSRQRAVSDASGQPSILQWLAHIRNTIEMVLNAQPWIHAFRDNGFGAQQTLVSTFIRRHLIEATELVVASSLPTVADIKTVFPNNRINVSSGMLIAWGHVPSPVVADLAPVPIVPHIVGPALVPPPPHQLVLHMDPVHMLAMPRPAPPLPPVVPRRPRAKHKPKSKPKAVAKRIRRVAVQAWYLAKFRKMFQGPENAINLGDTQSGRFSYRVDLWGVKMVICSNHWMGKVQALPDKKDQEYIWKNCIYYKCDAPLWDDPALRLDAVPPPPPREPLGPQRGSL